jgi:hypothetical protein
LLHNEVLRADRGAWLLERNKTNTHAAVALSRHAGAQVLG